jgi:hypothetical protein
MKNQPECFSKLICVHCFKKLLHFIYLVFKMKKKKEKKKRAELALRVC